MYWIFIWNDFASSMNSGTQKSWFPRNIPPFANFQYQSFDPSALRTASYFQIWKGGHPSSSKVEQTQLSSSNLKPSQRLRSTSLSSLSPVHLSKSFTSFMIQQFLPFSFLMCANERGEIFNNVKCSAVQLDNKMWILSFWALSSGDGGGETVESPCTCTFLSGQTIPPLV